LPAPNSVLPYKIEIHDKHVLSEEEVKTQEYDKLAFRIVSIGTAPFLVGVRPSLNRLALLLNGEQYTIYSMLYETHRGWYSFVIGTLTSLVPNSAYLSKLKLLSFVYLFGFVQLVPQRASSALVIMHSSF
jgi:hypothetical protein